MKKKITDEETIKKVLKEVRSVYKKHNAYPMMEVNLSSSIGEFVLYELDKLTKEEKIGTFK